ncbi:MAG: pilus assembly protein PilM, partial [Tepidisphaeraceae bacterium]
RDLLAQGRFRGRAAVLSLPASCMFIQHLRLPKMDEEALKKALPWEARGKLPIDPSQALLRHLVAGEIYQDQEPKNEVIVMAAGRELVTQYLATAAKAKLDVVGMNVEPKALVDCFSHVFRRKTDSEATNCFVDIGCVGARVVIARGGQILFARVIPIGGEHFNRAVAAALKINPEDAKLLRIKLCAMQPALDEHRQRQELAPSQPAPTPAPAVAPDPAAVDGEENSFALLGAGMAASRKRDAEMPRPAAPSQPIASVPAETDTNNQVRAVEQACREPLGKLVAELDMCRRYHEATFPSMPVDRLVFVGGEARHRSLCQYVAREMGLAAQVGDPMVRMGRVSEIGIESGIDRRQAQPAWSVAIGLSMGPADASTGGGGAPSSTPVVAGAQS